MNDNHMFCIIGKNSEPSIFTTAPNILKIDFRRRENFLFIIFSLQLIFRVTESRLDFALTQTT